MKHMALIGQTLTVLLATTAVASAEDYWLKTLPDNCAIWSDQPLRDGDVITWSGACSDGKASGNGLLLWTRDGTVQTQFDGQMGGGHMNGKGALVELAESGDGYNVVTGEFRNSQPDGEITFKSSDNAFFSGQFKDGRMDGPVLWVEADGGSFEGVFVNGAAQGQGRTVSADGEVYQGAFRDNEREGQGTLLMSDGSRYSGQFHQGEMSGLGRFDDPSGDSYEGAFKAGLPDGPGVFTTAEGETYQGVFLMGELNGQVLVTAKDGSQTVETWENGEKKK